ncbi:MAG: flagellar basal body-associated protein FliL [Pseudomonadota bacterium]
MATKPSLKPVESAPAATEAAPSKKKGKMMLIAGVLAVVLGGGGGGAWYFLHGNKEAPAAGAEGAVEGAEKEKDKKPSVYLALESFTVNMQGEGDHYLQIGIVLQLADNAIAEEIKLQMPPLRNRLLLLLSSKTPQQLAKPEDKQKFAAEIVEEARQILPGKPGDRGIQNILFSSFIIQ